MGFGSKILNTSVSSLIAQQAVIATTSNNIANANTPGYAKRTVNLETRADAVNGGQLAVGSGVQIGNVQRSADEYIDKLLRGAISDNSSATTTNDFLNRVQQLFTLDGSAPTIGTSLTDFYTAVNDLATNPSSSELRTNLIERGQDLVSSIKTTYNQIADLQTEADKRVSSEIDQVNSLASQIAQTNSEIRTQEAGGRQVAADQRDQRDLLLQKLSEKIGFTTIPHDDGTVDIFLGKGFALVSGSTARALETTTSPSFSPGALPPSLGGSVLSYVVYDYGSGASSSQIDLTQSLQSGGGSIGALLTLRGYNDPSNTSPFQANGTLVDTASRIEAITKTLLSQVNQSYLGPDENSGVAGHQPSSGDLSGNAPAVYGLFDFTYNGTRDADGNGLPDDLTAISTISNYSSILNFAVTNPSRIAAALDQNAAAGATSFSVGDNSNLTRLSASLRASYTISAGSFSFTGTLNEAYNNTVTAVGTDKARAQTDLNVAESSLLSAQTQHDNVSGVSLDEEFTSLIKFQKAFQASARMIKIADDLLTQIVQLV